MEKKLTAKEMFDKMLSEDDGCTSTEMMECYAAQQVEIAVKKALEIVIKEKKAYQSTGLIVEITDTEILSLYPKVIETINPH